MRHSALRRAAAAIVVAGTIVANVVIVANAQTGHEVPPPTPVPPHGSPSPFPSALQTPSDPTAVPTIGAASALLADLDDGTVFFRKAADSRRPIASLTKIMTALVVLEHTSLRDTVRVHPQAVFARGDFGASSTLGLRAGERVAIRDLLYALLLGSANDAAEALAIHVGGGVDAFVDLMNRRARRLGMDDTTFASPHGLDDRGRSTAADVLTLLRAAHADPRFSEAVATRFHRVRSPRGRPRRIQNRNALLWLYPGAIGTKTGLTSGAGPSVAAVAERDDRRLAAIVLGADGEAFSSAATLLDHGFEGFEEVMLVRAGDAVGDVPLPGGEVPVVAGSDLQAPIPTRFADDVRRRVRVLRGAAFPPVPGERVATLVVSAPGLRLGAVPLVVASVPPPEPATGSWWVRGLGTLVRATVDAVDALAD